MKPIGFSGVRYQVSGIRYQVSGVRCQVSGIRYQVSGIRCQVLGTWDLSRLNRSVLRPLYFGTKSAVSKRIGSEGDTYDFTKN